VKKSPVTFTSRTENPDLNGVFDVAPEEVSKFASQVHLVDVRQPSEYTGELGHVAGSQLIVLDTIPERIETLPKDEPIVFICRSGGRSARATAYAQQLGFSQVYNMRGGMLLWNSLGLPLNTSSEA
jgi:rhodanese-related sulfurtransferase